MAKEKSNTKKLGKAAVKVHFFSPENERMDFRSAHIYQVVADAGGVKVYLWEFFHSKRALSIAILIILVFSIIAQPLGAVIVDLFRKRDSSAIFAVEGESGTTLYNGEKINVGTATAINLGISEDSRFTKVSVGPSHSLALDAEGNIYAWGSDEYGQIGDGINEAAHTTDCDSGDCVISPVNLSIITGVDYPNILYGKTIVDISAGSTHSLALDNEGNLYAWGDNRDGQIGDGDATLNHHEDKVLAPVHVKIVDPSSRVRRPATAISAAEYFSTAIDDIGNFYSWGRNADHELGDNTTESSNEPVALTRDRANPLHGKKVKEVRATRSHTTVVTENDQTYTWGKSDYQIPIPVETNADTTDITSIDTTDDTIISEVKEEIDLPKDTALLSVSDNSGAAVTESGELYTWGEDNIGEACSTYMPSAVKINGLATEKLPCNTIVISNDAQLSEKTVSLTTLSSPDQSILAQPGAINITSVKPSQITVGEEKVIVISGSGFLPGSVQIAQIAASYHDSMALTTNGDLYMWGLNQYGDIGIGNTSKVTSPTKINGINGGTNEISANTKLRKIATGIDTSFAVDTNGQLYAWGNNNRGQLGVGSTNKTVRSPTRVNGNGAISTSTNIIDIAAGYYHGIALDNHGTVYSWGENVKGELGTGKGSTTMKCDKKDCAIAPVTVPGLSGISFLRANNWLSAAVSSSGRVYMWGDNSATQITGSSSPDTVYTPLEITHGALSSATVRDLALTGTSTLAIDTSGRLYSWGDGSNGRLGLGSTNRVSDPALVNGQGELSSTANIASVGAGNGAVYAIDQSGKLYAWGANGYGQVGLADGNLSDVTSPRLINGRPNSPITNSTKITAIASGSMAIHALALASDGALYAWGNDSFGQIGDGNASPDFQSGTVSNVYTPRNVISYGDLSSQTTPVTVALDGSSISADISENSISFTTSSSVPKTSTVTVSNGSSSGSADISFVEQPVKDPERPAIIIPPTAEEKPVINIPTLPKPPADTGSSSNSEQPDYSDPKWTFTSTEQRVGISPSLDKGYRLYLSSTAPTLKATGLPDISPISGTLDDPATLELATWGFALSHKDIFVPHNNFDDSYSPQTPKSRYAGISATPLLVYDSPDPTAVVRLYYGIRAASPGTDTSGYTTTITFTIISN
ncbi:hypothetical protein LJC07_06370 [Christensenellaceae bacterium OttesenSCG-928-L17]|nr:hypothetical protein [Christensenellaceae bacterium OttesenSCG-928-L17]